MGGEASDLVALLLALDAVPATHGDGVFSALTVTMPEACGVLAALPETAAEAVDGKN